jgi:hypothetical protein
MSTMLDDAEGSAVRPRHDRTRLTETYRNKTTFVMIPGAWHGGGLGVQWLNGFGLPPGRQ